MTNCGTIKNADKKHECVCKAIKYFIGDEHKAQGEYQDLAEWLFGLGFTKTSSSVRDVKMQEGHHEQLFKEFYNENCNDNFKKQSRLMNPERLNFMRPSIKDNRGELDVITTGDGTIVKLVQVGDKYAIETDLPVQKFSGRGQSVKTSRWLSESLVKSLEGDDAFRVEGHHTLFGDSFKTTVQMEGGGALIINAGYSNITTINAKPTHNLKGLQRIMEYAREAKGEVN